VEGASFLININEFLVLLNTRELAGFSTKKSFRAFLEK